MNASRRPRAHVAIAARSAVVSGGSTTGWRVVVGVVAVIVSLIAAAVPVRAWWTDQASPAAGTFQAVTIDAPALTCISRPGVLGIAAHAEIAWPHLDTRFEYTWRADPPDGEVTSGTLAPTGGAGSTVMLTLGALELAEPLLGRNEYQIYVRARLKAPNTTWVGAEATTPVWAALLSGGCV